MNIVPCLGASRRGPTYLSLILILLLSGVSFADSLSVEKLVEKTDLSAGDTVQVLLKFSNPFGQQIPMKIVDKNIIGGNGLDVQCLEFKLPADRSQTIGYEPIPSFQSGSFTLDKAQVTYTNPQTGKEETVSSNSFDVTLKPSGAQGTQQGITTIYQCGGTNIRSTSLTSSGQQPQPPPQSQAQQQAQQTQNKVQGMQQQNMQDMNAVKQQMEQQQKQEKELKDRIEQDPDFKKMQEELQKQGYSKKQSQINPEQTKNAQSSQSQNSNSPQQNQQSPKNPAAQSQNQNSQAQPSASFKYDFQKPTGENATIHGKVEQGNLTQISKWSAEDAKALSDKITQDPKFQQLSRSLQKQGFNQTGQNIAPPSGNLSQFTYSFSNLNETRNITGTATPQGNITSINIEQPEKKSDTYFWLSLILLLLLAYFLYLKHRKKPVSELPLEKEVRINYHKEALIMIAEAEQLFSQNKPKDAFSLLSEAVRFYFKHKIVADKKELSTSDLLAHLKSHDRTKLKPAQECLNLCDLVVFAKFAPDAKGFSRTAALAKKLVLK